MDLRPLMPPPERFENIRAAFEETGGSFLSPVKEILGDDYSYDEIRLVWDLPGASRPGSRGGLFTRPDVGRNPENGTAMPYKCAIVGVSGGRANGHADAYAHVRRGRLACIATRNRENLDAFGERWSVDSRYTDYREMFEREKPDLVHVNTPPDVRLEVMEAAEAAGVGALILREAAGDTGGGLPGDRRRLRAAAS